MGRRRKNDLGGLLVRMLVGLFSGMTKAPRRKIAPRKTTFVVRKSDDRREVPRIKSQREIRDLLNALRSQADSKGIKGRASIDIHLTLAYFCRVSPHPAAIYNVPVQYRMSRTDFFKSHPAEIQKGISGKASWDFLHSHALEKIAVQKALSASDAKHFGLDSPVSCFDPRTKRWVSIEVPRIRWFDDRDFWKSWEHQTEEDIRESAYRRLDELKKIAKLDPSELNKSNVKSFKAGTIDRLDDAIRRNYESVTARNNWVKAVSQTRELEKSIYTILREVENEVRSSRGVPLIGESWVKETDLYYRVSKLLPAVEVIQHGRPPWLRRQHFDIWIPSMSVAIEYHGQQHFSPIDFFGGHESFLDVQERDEFKRTLCSQHGVRLIEIRHDQAISDDSLRSLILNSPRPRSR